MPANPIAVPGMKPLGLAMNLLRSSKVQVPPLAFMAAEKLNPRPSPRASLTTPKRFGPTRFGPPFSKVWQAAHFLAAAAPFSTEAVCSSFSIGSDGAAGAAGPPLVSSFTAISKPGFSSGLGVKIACAAKLVTRTRMQAPRILLSSKESIVDQAPGRKVTKGPEEAAVGKETASGIRLSKPSLSRVEISVCPASGNPVKRANSRPISLDPHYFRRVFDPP